MMHPLLLSIFTCNAFDGKHPLRGTFCYHEEEKNRPFFSSFMWTPPLTFSFDDVAFSDVGNAGCVYKWNR